MADLLAFPLQLDGDAGYRAAERMKRFERFSVNARHLPADLGSPNEWLGTAIMHLHAASSRRPNCVAVNRAALTLVLAWLERMGCD